MTYPSMPGYPRGIITTRTAAPTRVGQYTLVCNSYQITCDEAGVVCDDSTVREE